METIADGVWGVSGSLRMGPGFYFPLRTTIFRVGEGSDAGLLVISPIQPGPWMDAVEKLGPVRFVIAPNALHHLFAGDAKSRWPQAKLLAAKKLGEKRKDLGVDGWLGESEIPGLKQIFMGGAPDLDETVFFHERSKSLVVTDLVFNIVEPQGFLTPWVLRMGGVNRRLGQSRLIRFLVKDRRAFAESGLKIMDLPFERLIPAHGAVVEHSAKMLFGEAIWWQRGGVGLVK